MSSGRRLSASVVRKVRKDRAKHSNPRPLHPSSLGPQARLALKANPVAMERRARRVRPDRRGLQARKEPLALPDRAESPDRLGRSARKGLPGLRDKQGIPKHAPPQKGSQALQDQQELSGPRDWQALPAHKGRRVLQGIRDHRDLRAFPGHGANPVQSAHPVRLVHLVLWDRRDLSGP